MNKLIMASTLMVAVSLAACGGGGGGTSTTPSSTAASSTATSAPNLIGSNITSTPIPSSTPAPTATPFQNGVTVTFPQFSPVPIQSQQPSPNPQFNACVPGGLSLGLIGNNLYLNLACNIAANDVINYSSDNAAITITRVSASTFLLGGHGVTVIRFDNATNGANLALAVTL